MVKVTLEKASPNCFEFKVSHTDKLYAIESGGIVVISPMRVKTCQVTFWDETEWAKALEKANRKAEREQKKALLIQSSKDQEPTK
jgi:hypothetical protein